MFNDDTKQTKQIPGRTFKIDVEYLPVHKEKSDKKTSNKIDVGPFIRIMQMIDKKVNRETRHKQHSAFVVF